MNPRTKIILRAVGIVVFLSLLSCKSEERLHPEEYYSKVTASGRNVLYFTLNGEPVYQRIGGPYLSVTYREATYKEDTEKGEMQIWAGLDNNKFLEISFTFPKDLVCDDATINDPSVYFKYCYLPEIYHWVQDPPDGISLGGKHRVVDREAEYRQVNVTTSRISIRRWSPEKKILAGNFTMQGNYTDSTGVVVHFNVTDGLFDVTDNLKPLSK